MTATTAARSAPTPGGEPAGGPAPRRGAPARRAADVLVPLALGLLTAVVVAVGLFGVSSREVTLASHEAVVRPHLAADLSGDLVLRTGPVLPDVRLPAVAPFEVEVELGKTEARSTGELIQRYAFIASQPEGQQAVVLDAVEAMALAAALRGLAAGAAVVGLWLLVGPARRREALARLRSRRGVAGAVAVVVVVALVWQPWDRPDDDPDVEQWESLQDFLGPEVPVPQEAAALEVGTGGVTTAGTRRLVLSAIDTYDRARAFYADAVEAAGALELRAPREGETVALLVSDRHDNVGMDPVAREVADVAGATVVLNAGDDTSTGSRWEAFSIDSLQEAFGDLERFAVPGNHDNGTFVADRLAETGWTVLDGEVVDGPGESRILGAPDPRASGLGTWRDEGGLSFAEHAERLADAACEADAAGERAATLLVHDANSGQPALDRGCVDLVLGGHLHVRVGPEPVVAPDGRTGWRYTNGTTGGAAYAIAVGSKLRRAADLALVTYREGRPIGIQGVTLQTNGVFVVDDWVPLTYTDPADDEGDDGEPGLPSPGLPGLSPEPSADPAEPAEPAPEPGQQVGPGTVITPAP